MKSVWEQEYCMYMRIFLDSYDNSTNIIISENSGIKIRFWLAFHTIPRVRQSRRWQEQLLLDSTDFYHLRFLSSHREHPFGDSLNMLSKWRTSKSGREARQARRLFSCREWHRLRWSSRSNENDLWPVMYQNQMQFEHILHIHGAQSLHSDAYSPSTNHEFIEWM